jgi:polyisoprenoid-binding protein YceI
MTMRGFTMTTSSDVRTQLPTGRWQVDPTRSELGFGARGMFGLVPVKGTFTQFAGTLTVAGEGASGQLEIQSASLDTAHAKRDTHLRSADFFDVETHPTLSFEVTGVTPGTDGNLSVTGVLRVRDSALAITTPVSVASESAERLTLSTTLDVDRTAAGLGWSKMGMIQGKAHLTVKLDLVKQA